MEIKRRLLCKQAASAGPRWHLLLPADSPSDHHSLQQRDVGFHHLVLLGLRKCLSLAPYCLSVELLAEAYLHSKNAAPLCPFTCVHNISWHMGGNVHDELLPLPIFQCPKMDVKGGISSVVAMRKAVRRGDGHVCCIPLPLCCFLGKPFESVSWKETRSQKFPSLER